MDEEKERKMYTQEELDEKKREFNRDQKMNFMMDMINDNTRDIRDIKDTLHNGWDRQIWYNTICRKGSLWLLGILLASGMGYLLTIM